MSFTTVTIDGVAGAGKSTVSSRVAQILKFKSLNTGDLYRAITYKFLKDGSTKLDNENDVENFVKTLDIKVEYKKEDNSQHTFCDGEDVTAELHTQKINQVVASVSPHQKIRNYVIKIQRQIASNNNIVAEGRDVGTNVLPNAKFKFYLTASVEVRAKRRLHELLQDGEKDLNFSTIEAQIRQRDEDDTNRAHGALKMAKDAVLVDTSNKTIEEVVEYIVSVVKKGK